MISIRSINTDSSVVLLSLFYGAANGVRGVFACSHANPSGPKWCWLTGSHAWQWAECTVGSLVVGPRSRGCWALPGRHLSPPNAGFPPNNTCRHHPLSLHWSRLHSNSVAWDVQVICMYTVKWPWWFTQMLLIQRFFVVFVTYGNYSSTVHATVTSSHKHHILPKQSAVRWLHPAYVQ